MREEHKEFRQHIDESTGAAFHRGAVDDFPISLPFYPNQNVMIASIKEQKFGKTHISKKSILIAYSQF